MSAGSVQRVAIRLMVAVIFGSQRSVRVALIINRFIPGAVDAADASAVSNPAGGPRRDLLD
jgi:hypothetical protein